MISTWTETEFDWHDIHVHGIRFLEGEHTTGELWLDLDYILDWIQSDLEGDAFRFRIAPASLQGPHDASCIPRGPERDNKT